MISDSTLNEIRDAVSVVDLVGDYVSLKKAGQGYVGLCPFHGEKTPSFHVHPLKQCFHCFGCQKGGNIFTFLCAIEGISFPVAVEKLAKRAGVTLQENLGTRKDTPRPLAIAENEKLLAANEWAAKYFNFLLVEGKEFQYARDYLKKRGISEKSIQRFRLGVSPRGWSTLIDLMAKRGFTFDELLLAGLVVAKEGSPSRGYDRFRERLMFPIRHIEGAVIGFGARLLHDEENQPKYLNSPESPLFSKRQILYGAFENQRAIRTRGEAIVVEGYMDVVGLSEHEVGNAIATMGTALTEQHCSQLRTLTNRVVTVFDSDAGGQEAWHRSVHLFLSSGIFAKDLSLPEGKDPDEFIQVQGAENFYQLCEKAPRQVTKLLKEIASKGSISEEEIAHWLQELTPILIASRRLPDRALLWDSISLILKVSVTALKELSESSMSRQPKSNQEGEKAAAVRPTPNRGIPAGPKVKMLDALDAKFFQTCLDLPEEFMKLPKASWDGLMKEPTLQACLTKLYEAGIKDWEKCLEGLVQTESNPQVQGMVSPFLFPDTEKIQNGEKAPDKSLLELLVEGIRQRRREVDIRSLSAQVRLTEKLGNDEEGLKLLEKLKELRTT